MAVSVLDISRILERVPVWRQRHRSATADADSIEPDGALPPARQMRCLCDRCFCEMQIVEQEKLDRLDVFGQVIHALACSECGFTTKKIYAAEEGYL